MHLPGDRRLLLSADGARAIALAPLASLAAGLVVAAALGLPPLDAALVSLFLFACVLVGLAQQTLP